MNLSKRHQEVFDKAFPEGYSTDKLTKRTGKVEDESGYFHIMYINIFPDGKHGRDVPSIQKYSVEDWEKTKKIFEVHDMAAVTGHDEYCVIHDPTVKKAEAGEAKAEVKPEVKKAKGRPSLK